MSNIRIFVEWEQPAVFAGEDVRCVITFKNVATVLSRTRSPSPKSPARLSENGPGHGRLVVSSQHSSPNKTRLFSYEDQRPLKPRARGHRSTLSLSAPVASIDAETANFKNLEIGATKGGNHKHKRSISIISIGANPSSDDERQLMRPTAQARKSHIRATSFQGIFPNSRGLLDTQIVPIGVDSLYEVGQRSSTLPMAFQNALPTNTKAQLDTLSPSAPLSSIHGSDGDLSFVDKGPPSSDLQAQQSGMPNGNPRAYTSRSLLSEEQQEVVSGDRSSPHATSSLSFTDTPRSSIGFYSPSNHSTETLASEYPASSIGRHEQLSRHRRHLSHLMPAFQETQKPETLIMGYVQLLGSFTLDGSLVNLTPFESVKRKGVIGGQGGGGVVGVGSSKRDSGLFGLGSLGWGNIGQSIGGFLKAQELSSIKEMKGIANSRSIPIISTPQSILFVDLSLVPGESKSFSYCHTLPQGIPPSHKGRAMKAAYHLAIGTQRPRSNVQQNTVQYLEIPFKVLPDIGNKTA